MAVRKPLVIVNGQVQQLQAADTIDVPTSGGTIISAENGNAGSIVIGAPVYVSDDDEVDKARANAIGTSHVAGLVRDASIAAAATGTIQTDGVLTATTAEWDAVTGETGGLTAGARYFLDAATAGKLTQTAPTTVGQTVVKVGKALSTLSMIIDIEEAILL